MADSWSGRSPRGRPPHARPSCRRRETSAPRARRPSWGGASRGPSPWCGARQVASSSGLSTTKPTGRRRGRIAVSG
eukprot:5923829-Pyramimonas_sp.AAC.1